MRANRVLAKIGIGLMLVPGIVGNFCHHQLLAVVWLAIFIHWCKSLKGKKI
jgi:hypothetical protein